MRRIILACLLPVLFASCSAPGKGSATGSSFPAGLVCEWATVVKVTDGDTIRVDFVDGALAQPVRYIGMDAPETVHPTLGVQPFGPEASARNKELVGNKKVCLERDISETDRYDRLLRYAWLPDGRMVNEVLVSEGLATVDTFPPDVKYVERFVADQRQAREANRGLWKTDP